MNTVYNHNVLLLLYSKDTIHTLNNNVYRHSFTYFQFSLIILHWNTFHISMEM